MRTRLRLGAATAIGLGALLLATVLASPALAWHSNVTVSARCLEGQVRIHYKVEAWEKQGHEATVDVSYKLNGEVTELESDDHFFGPKHNQFSGHFDLAAGTTGTITFLAVAHWSNGETSHDKGSAELPPADKCAEEPPAEEPPAEEPPAEEPPAEEPPAEEPPAEEPAEEEPAPEAPVAPRPVDTTDDAEVGAVTSTTGGDQLPDTGATAGPMLIAGIALVAGGILFLMVSQVRDHHATK
jgi:LPXTG-motif cell wall-anchored protein